MHLKLKVNLICLYYKHAKSTSKYFITWFGMTNVVHLVYGAFGLWCIWCMVHLVYVSCMLFFDFSMFYSLNWLIQFVILYRLLCFYEKQLSSGKKERKFTLNFVFINLSIILWIQNIKLSWCKRKKFVYLIGFFMNRLNVFTFTCEYLLFFVKKVS